MTTTLYAQPYDISAKGFIFENAAQYREQAAKSVNDYGDPVEEFEIQFIDGDKIDSELAEAINLNQANFADHLELVDAWEEWEKLNTIIAVGELGHDFDPGNDPNHYGIDIYGHSSLRDLAEEFVADGIMGEIPDHLQFYIDYDAIAHDLSMEYTETEIAGERLIYRAS